MEYIFENTLGSRSDYSILEDEDYEAALKAAMADSVDYEQSYLSLDRSEAANYYYGNYPAIQTTDDQGNPVNRSSVVSTDVRDTIMTIMPSLVRIFSNPESVVNFEGRTASQVDMAKQATGYVRYKFWDANDGFMICHSLFKDALSQRLGIAKVWTDVTYRVKEHTFRFITPEQYQLLIYEGGKNLEILDVQQNEDGTLNCHLRYLDERPSLKVAAVPPEEFRIARNAKSVETARLIGHERLETVSFVVQQGFDLEFVTQYLTSDPSVYSDERYLRNPGLSDNFGEMGVIYGEWYITIDSDGDGIDEMHYVTTIGENHDILTDDIVEDHNFAVFAPDPRPHTILSDSIFDLTKDVQRIKTAMIRGMLDNLAETVNPKTVINELITNVEDALNDEVGAVIRTRGDPNASVSFLRTPFVGADVQTGIDYMDQVRASRTGITEASKGLDPKAMQSTALVGIDAIVSGAQERIELIARILAETGFKRLFKIMLREAINNQNQPEWVTVNGEFAQVNPSLFDPQLRISVNPTLGKGTDIVRMQALGEIKAMQLTVIEKFGIGNPVVTPQHLMNTMQDMLAITNIKNFNRYFAPITPELQAAITSAPKEPDPTLLVAQAEMEKVKKDMTVAIAKDKREDEKLRLQREKMVRDDDFRRDQLNVEAALDAAQIAADGRNAVIKQQTELEKLNKEDNSNAGNTETAASGT